MNGLALCAGIGGLELGLRLALGDAYRCVGYVEREGFAAATLVARMEDETMDPAPVWDDLATFDGRPWRGVVDIVSSGFPCQPWSVAGRRRGIGDDRWLWPHIARVVADVAPSIVFLENVPGLVGHGLRIVWTDLRRMGYGVRAGIFSAAEVGAPHLRKRLFVLAHRPSERLDGIDALLQRRGPREDSPQTTGGGEGMADSGRLGDGRLQSKCESRRQKAASPGGASEKMANASQQPAGEPWDWGLWPPGRDCPGGDGAWRRSSLPRIRRASYGDAARLDERLSALGNGVVPLVAAHAFRTLALKVKEGR